MVISVFPNLNNNGVSELAFDVIKILTDGGADVYVQNEYKPIFKSTKAKFENFDKAMNLLKNKFKKVNLSSYTNDLLDFAIVQLLSVVTVQPLISLKKLHF